MAHSNSSQLAANAGRSTIHDLEQLAEILHQRADEFQADAAFATTWTEAAEQLIARADLTTEAAEAAALHHVAQHLLSIKEDAAFERYRDHAWAADLRLRHGLPDINSSVIDFRSDECLHWYGDIVITLRHDETFAYGDPEYGQILAGTTQICVTNQRLHFIGGDGDPRTLPIQDLVLLEHPGMQRLLTPVGTITFFAVYRRTLAAILTRVQQDAGHRPCPLGPEQEERVPELVEQAVDDDGDWYPVAPPAQDARTVPGHSGSAHWIWTSPVFILEHELTHLLSEARPAQARVQVDLTGSVLVEIRHIVEEGLNGPGTCEWSPPTVFRVDALTKQTVDLFAWSSGEERYERSLLAMREFPPAEQDSDSAELLGRVREASNKLETGGRFEDVFASTLDALHDWIRASPVHPADVARWASHDLGEAVESQGVWTTGNPPWAAEATKPLIMGGHSDDCVILDGPGVFNPLSSMTQFGQSR